MSLLHKTGVISVTESVTTIILKDRGLYNLNLNEKFLNRRKRNFVSLRIPDLYSVRHKNR